MKYRKIGLLVFLISWALFLIGVYFAYQNPTTGYELSIYTSTPNIVWLSFGIIVFIGIIITSYEIVSKKFKNRKTWLSGLILIILGRTGIY
ncbi:MAG: hypothetical protein ACOCT9_01060, partial [archaeon]